MQVSARLRRRRRDLLVDATAVLVGLGFGATLSLAVTSESASALAAPGGVATAVGRVAGLTAAYVLMVMVLLMARIPALERAVGQDRLARWHRTIGPWPVVLVAVHAFSITLGYAQAAQTGMFHEAWVLIRSYADVLAATVGFGLLVMVAIVSVKVARSQLRYETWWAVHLYVYLALVLAFAHQIVTGVPFVGHPLARILWTCAWAGTALTVLVFRVGLPIVQSCRHRLKVVAIHEEGPGVVSVICSGRKLERLGVEGGQFFQWRFLTKGRWWQAHPYSLSALPAPPFVRVTVRSLGDHSGSLASIPIGTRVAIEGPYGVFTGERRRGERVLLVGAGVGVTPLRAILEGLPPQVDTTVIVRSSSPDGLVLHDELTDLVRERAGRLHELVGPRETLRLDSKLIRQLVPDIKARDVYVCGPEGFAEAFVKVARRLGVPEERIHREAFAF